MLVLSRVELCIKRGDYATALELIEKHGRSLTQETFDIATQIRLLTLKARIFAKTDQAERGFSLAMRAATIAQRSRFMSGMWEALGSVSNILMEFEEFEAARALLESIIPQVIESESCRLVASTYSLLVDANMGMAGQTRSEPARQKEYLARAVELIDCAFAEYSKMEDVQGQSEMMAKKATVMHLTGDYGLANDYAAKYLDLKRQAAAEQ
jgi:anaphase-promoting complex subunit 5